MTTTNLPPFDPMNQHRSCPHEFYARSRAEQPLTYVPEFGMWLAARDSDCRYILNHPDLFSSVAATPATEAVNPPDVMQRWKDRCGGDIGRNIITLDAPEHRQLRALWGHLLRQGRIDAAAPFMRQTADALIDRVADTGAAELVGQFTRPYVARVLAYLLGVPQYDAERMVTYNDAVLLLLAPAATAEERREAVSLVEEFEDYIGEILADRRLRPRDDVLSEVAAAAAAEKISDADARMLVRGLYAGGIHTTVNAIGHAVHTALTEGAPGLWVEVQHDPERAAGVFEESLRLQSPLRGMGRRVTAPVTIAGVDLAPGDIVAPLLGSANRDEDTFHAAETFNPCRDLHREGTHLAFGDGAHRCLGRRLARTEGGIALRALATRLPTARLADDRVLTYQRAFFFWGLEELHLAWSPSRLDATCP